MIQIDANKVDELLKQAGTSLAENPDLAQQIEHTNARLATSPELDLLTVLTILDAALEDPE